MILPMKLKLKNLRMTITIRLRCLSYVHTWFSGRGRKPTTRE